jgi:hypothetical protein
MRHMRRENLVWNEYAPRSTPPTSMAHELYSRHEAIRWPAEALLRIRAQHATDCPLVINRTRS